MPHPYPEYGSWFLGAHVVDLAGPIVLWTRGDLVAGLMATRLEG